MNSFYSVIKNKNPASLFSKNHHSLDKDFISVFQPDFSVKNIFWEKFSVIEKNEIGMYLNEIKKTQTLICGGYLENRIIYSRSRHFGNSNIEETRTIHLGIDLWLPAGTCIYAPLSGEIAGYSDQNRTGDYGPVLILKHSFSNFSFYSLYGHLSRKSIENRDWQMGKIIEKGECLGKIGDDKENGNWPAHLHFQCMFSLADHEKKIWINDYPGVCKASTLSFYEKNCPDPSVFLSDNFE